MNLKVVIWICIFSLCNFSYAANPKLSCSKDKLIITFINGVGNSYDDAMDTSRRLTIMLENVLVDQKGYEAHDGVDNVVKPLYNHSNGFLIDTYESAYFKLREQVKGGGQGTSIVESLFNKLLFKPIVFLRIMSELGFDPRPVMDTLAKPFQPSRTFEDREKFITSLRSFASQGRKILIISHSEGTLYSNMVTESIENLPPEDELKRNVFGSLMFGPAASILPRNSKGGIAGEYVLNVADVIVQGVTSLPSNMTIQEDNTPENSKGLLHLLGHGVLEIYLSENIYALVDSELEWMPLIFKKKVEAVVGKLVGNDKYCCGLAKEGRLWYNEEICESESCIGGFLEESVTIPSDVDSFSLQIDKFSAVCREVKLSPGIGKKIDLKSSWIYGPAEISGNVSLKKVYLDAVEGTDFEKAIIKDKVQIDFSGTTFLGPNIKGRPQISENVLINSNKPERIIYGSPTISGNVIIEGSTIQEVESSNKKSIFSQISIESGSNKTIKIINSSLKGKLSISDYADFNTVIMDGSVTTENVTLSDLAIRNFYYSTEDKPGIKIVKNVSCTVPLVISNKEIKDEVDIWACGTISNSNISGHSSIKGLIEVTSSTIQGESYDVNSMPLRIVGEGNIGIKIQGNSFVYNRPLIQGELIINNSTIKNNGSYKGRTQVLPDGTKTTSQIDGSTMTGSNDFSGLYFVRKSMNDVTIVGGYQTITNNWLSLLIDASATVQAGATVKGVGTLAGTIGSGATFEGYKIHSDKAGIFIEPGSSFIGSGKSIKGTVYMNNGALASGTNITGSQVNHENLAIMHIDNSKVYNSTLTGIGRLYSNSTAIGATLTGYRFLVENATLSGTYVLDSNTYLCNKSYGAVSIPSDHNCHAESVKFNEELDYEKLIRKNQAPFLSQKRNLRSKSI